MSLGQLSREDVHVDAILSNYVQVDYANQDMIATQVCPPLYVQKESDIFYKRLKDKRWRNTVRAPGTAAGLVDVSFTKDSYFCEEYAQASVLPDRIKNNADSILNLERSKAEQAKDAVILDLEMRVKSLAEACSYSNAAAAPWNGTSLTPDPQLDIDTAVYNILGRTGLRPNRIKLPVLAIMGLDRYLKAAANITDPRSLVQRIDTLSNLWGLQVIPVFNQYDKANEGKTEALTQIWTATEAIVFYAEESASLEAQGWMNLFTVKQNGMSELVRRWYDEKTRAEYFEYSILCEPKVCNSKAAEKITAITA
jgi:hypothetical protein